MFKVSSCLSCGRGWCEECGIHDCCTNEGPFVVVKEVEPKKLGRPQLLDEDVIDPRSTGRKRANAVKPITPGMICEWAMQKNCGGGKHPIVGCSNSEAKHVHHHDKDKMHNEPENLSRLCTRCHNEWHSRNDKDFDPSILHSPEPATEQEVIDYWIKRGIK